MCSFMMISHKGDVTDSNLPRAHRARASMRMSIDTGSNQTMPDIASITEEMVSKKRGKGKNKRMRS